MSSSFNNNNNARPSANGNTNTNGNAITNTSAKSQSQGQIPNMLNQNPDNPNQVTKIVNFGGMRIIQTQFVNGNKNNHNGNRNQMQDWMKNGSSNSNQQSSHSSSGNNQNQNITVGSQVQPQKSDENEIENQNADQDQEQEYDPFWDSDATLPPGASPTNTTTTSVSPKAKPQPTASPQSALIWQLEWRKWQMLAQSGSNLQLGEYWTEQQQSWFTNQNWNGNINTNLNLENINKQNSNSNSTSSGGSTQAATATTSSSAASVQQFHQQNTWQQQQQMQMQKTQNQQMQRQNQWMQNFMNGKGLNSLWWKQNINKGKGKQLQQTQYQQQPWGPNIPKKKPCFLHKKFNNKCKTCKEYKTYLEKVEEFEKEQKDQEQQKANQVQQLQQEQRSQSGQAPDGNRAFNNNEGSWQQNSGEGGKENEMPLKLKNQFPSVMKNQILETSEYWKNTVCKQFDPSQRQDNFQQNAKGAKGKGKGKKGKGKKGKKGKNNQNTEDDNQNENNDNEDDNWNQSQETILKNIIKEIEENVTHAEPYHYAESPSNLFCLVYLLSQIKLTKGQLNQQILKSKNAFVKAAGLLFVRIFLDGTELWQYFQHFVFDEQEFMPFRLQSQWNQQFKDKENQQLNDDDAWWWLTAIDNHSLDRSKSSSYFNQDELSEQEKILLATRTIGEFCCDDVLNTLNSDMYCQDWFHFPRLSIPMKRKLGAKLLQCWQIRKRMRSNVQIMEEFSMGRHVEVFCWGQALDEASQYNDGLTLDFTWNKGKVLSEIDEDNLMCEVEIQWQQAQQSDSNSSSSGTGRQNSTSSNANDNQQQDQQQNQHWKQLQIPQWGSWSSSSFVSNSSNSNYTSSMKDSPSCSQSSQEEEEQAFRQKNQPKKLFFRTVYLGQLILRPKHKHKHPSHNHSHSHHHLHDKDDEFDHDEKKADNWYVYDNSDDENDSDNPDDWSREKGKMLTAGQFEEKYKMQEREKAVTGSRAEVIKSRGVSTRAARMGRWKGGGKGKSRWTHLEKELMHDDIQYQKVILKGPGEQWLQQSSLTINGIQSSSWQQDGTINAQQQQQQQMQSSISNIDGTSASFIAGSSLSSPMSSIISSPGDNDGLSYNDMVPSPSAHSAGSGMSLTGSPEEAGAGGILDQQQSQQAQKMQQQKIEYQLRQQELKRKYQVGPGQGIDDGGGGGGEGGGSSSSASKRQKLTY